MADTIPFLNLAETTARYSREIHEAVARVIDSGRYLNGEATSRFESALATSCGADYAIGTSNGLDAIRLIVRAAIETGRLSPGDEVICPANTYIASVIPFREFGFRIRLVEPDTVTMNLNPARALEAAGPRTRCLMAVHLYGYPCWSEELNRLAGRGIFIIEDNAQAIGARSATPGLRGTHITGGLGHAAAFSFYPTKNVGALGDAGAVTTSDKELADAVRALANYGSDRRYHNIYCGYNCRLDEIQAAILEVKLRHLDEESCRRNAAARLYAESITNPAITLPCVKQGDTHVWHQYVIRTPHRDALKTYLAGRGIMTDIHYAVPPHLQPCFAGQFSAELPITERLASEVLSLPIANMTESNILRIAEALNAWRN